MAPAALFRHDEAMESLDTLLQNQVYHFLLIFARVGSALMLMPGTGDVFVPGRIRLYIGLGMAAVMTPALSGYLPPVPASAAAFGLFIGVEVLIGIFTGTIARILLLAMDTAGMVISLVTGFANAQLFNPTTATQGSLYGGFLSTTALVLIFVTNLHHLLIGGIFESYSLFAPGRFPAPGDMADMIAMIVQVAFALGVMLALPFLIVGGMIHLMMGVLARLMPQLNILILSLPLQLLTGFITLFLVIGVILTVWADRFAAYFGDFISGTLPAGL